MIIFQNVFKTFGITEVLHNLSFQIAPGELVCFTGPGGAGTSTILHLLIRLTDTTNGAITVDGADLSDLPRPILQIYRSRTGILFQDRRMIADRTVRENVALSLEATGASDDVINREVTALLKHLSITGIADAYPRELFQGQTTLVALARAMIHAPSILLLDDPTAGLTSDEVDAVLALIRKTNAQGTTVIMASRDPRIVEGDGPRIIELSSGKIVKDSHAAAAPGHQAKAKEQHAGDHVRAVGVG